jgi:drug/metabolite transporter (DMT)-like permease
MTGSFPFDSDVMHSTWIIYSLILGGLFLTGFNIAAASVKYYGITLTTIMQRMSLILTSAFAIIIYHESAPVIKILGILIAVLAVVLVNQKKHKFHLDQKKGLYIVFPALTFIMSGIIEIILYVVEVNQFNQDADIQFTTHAFATAAILGGLILAFFYSAGKVSFKWKHLAGGIALGVPNFFSIYLILIILGKGYEGSIFFPILNISVLALSAILGILIFYEKMNVLNLIGLGISIISIILISIASWFV